MVWKRCPFVEMIDQAIQWDDRQVLDFEKTQLLSESCAFYGKGGFFGGVKIVITEDGNNRGISRGRRSEPEGKRQEDRGSPI